MKFQPDTLEGVNNITRHEPGRVWVGAQVHTHSLLVPWVGEVQPWAADSLDALTAELTEAENAFQQARHAADAIAGQRQQWRDQAAA